MSTYKTFDSYFVRLHGGTAIQSNVLCYSGNALQGTLVFHDDADTMDPTVDALGRVSIYMRPSLIGPVLDVLRNEKPLALYVDTGATWGMLLSGDREPVGEEET